jgi:hypothetical protein
VTREEQLHWWRQGYTAGLAAGSRERQDRGEADHLNAVAEFRARRQADRQAAADALILEAVDVLARAMLGETRQARLPGAA